MTDTASPAEQARGPRTAGIRDVGGPRAAAAAWLVGLALCALVFIETNFVPASGPAPVSAAAAGTIPPPGMLDPLARLVMGAPAEQRAEALQVIGMFSPGPAGTLRVAMMEAEVVGPERAVKSLEGLEAIPEGTVLAEEASLVRRLVEQGPPALSEAERARIESNHGFIGRLAVSRGLAESDPRRDALRQEADRTFFRVLVLEVVGLGGFVLAVLTSVATGIVFLVLGRVRASLAPAAAGGSVFIETFAVFMCAMLAVREIGPLLRDSIGPMAILLQWLVAPTVFWPLLRRTPWVNLKYAMGWHTGRGFFREVGAGIVGYLACVPLIVMGVLCTLLLGIIRAWVVGGEAEPTTHPIGALLAGADFWMLVAIASLAVVWAPLVEESIFRGALYHHLRARLHWTVAGLTQAVLFAAVHPQGWVAIPALGSIGLSLSLLREWRTSLIPGITAHAMNNGTIVTLLVIVSNL
ncbi:MAG: lysostaphin resistance A-like protein [Phycisphaerales bacterium]